MCLVSRPQAVVVPSFAVTSRDAACSRLEEANLLLLFLLAFYSPAAPLTPCSTAGATVARNFILCASGIVGAVEASPCYCLMTNKEKVNIWIPLLPE